MMLNIFHSNGKACDQPKKWKSSYILEIIQLKFVTHSLPFLNLTLIGSQMSLEKSFNKNSFLEVYSHYQINVTKNCLEYDLKLWQQQTLTIELDQILTMMNLTNWTWPKNILFSWQLIAWNFHFKTSIFKFDKSES